MYFFYRLSCYKNKLFFHNMQYKTTNNTALEYIKKRQEYAIYSYVTKIKVFLKQKIKQNLNLVVVLFQKLKQYISSGMYYNHTQKQNMKLLELQSSQQYKISLEQKIEIQYHTFFIFTGIAFFLPMF